MKKLFRFSELSKKAQKKAAQEYLNGFNEIKENKDDYMSFDDAYSCCKDNDDLYLYNKEGKLMNV